MINKDSHSGISPMEEIYKARKEDRFSDLMLLSWGYIETDVDLALRHAFDISHDDPKNDLVLHHPFRRKVEFLKKSGYFTNDEVKTLLDFEKERNDMFHNLFKGLIFDIQKLEIRGSIMDKAVVASRVCMDASAREISNMTNVPTHAIDAHTQVKITGENGKQKIEPIVDKEKKSRDVL